MLKRIIILLCVIALFSTLLASCGNASADPKESGKGSSEAQSGNNSQGQGNETESETWYMPELPDTQYNRSFRTVHWTVDEAWIPWDEISVDRLNGDIMNDSVYERNTAVGERFNVTFETVYHETYGLNDVARRLVLDGSGDYDMVVQRGVNLALIYTEGLFHSIGDLTYVDLDNPWWTRDSIDSLALGNIQQFVASDMLVLDKSATACIIYNSVVADRYKDVTGDMYETVRVKQWDLEEMIRICEQVAQDLDNDGRFNGDADLLACEAADDPVHFLYTGAGLRFMERDEDGHFVYTYGQGDSISIEQEIFDTFLYADWFRNSYVDALNITKFKNNEELFTVGIVKGTNVFRSNESDYGVLPIPMFDDSQGQYYSEVSPHHDSLMCIPLSVSDPSFVGVMMEALSAEAHYTSYPTFYNVIINGRSIRDEESREMLKIIFESRVYDAGLVYDLDNFASSVLLRSTAKSSVNLASQFASYRNAINSKLEDLNELIDELNAKEE